jgi:hypothetical protein
MAFSVIPGPDPNESQETFKLFLGEQELRITYDYNDLFDYFTITVVAVDEEDIERRCVSKIVPSLKLTDRSPFFRNINIFCSSNERVGTESVRADNIQAFTFFLEENA